ncbi:hypothetical protein Cantr_00032 [Candida viswanathii]|uniref:Uncharacterized protein n=1 Tax=Candida viswanathii TaxID=5486 RepID=A0A367YF55_9ASCO|nr:hypothetical protein Cantr_00032 [Candida viswanathii]
MAETLQAFEPPRTMILGKILSTLVLLTSTACFDTPAYIRHLRSIKDDVVTYPQKAYVQSRGKFMTKYKSGRNDITYGQLYDVEVKGGAIVRDEEENRWVLCDELLNVVAELHDEYVEFLGLGDLADVRPTINELRGMKSEMDGMDVVLEEELGEKEEPLSYLEYLESQLNEYYGREGSP